MSKKINSRIIAGLKYPSLANIKGRSSTIRAEFIKSVIPEILPSTSQAKEALAILRQDEGKLVCAYCGDKPSEWDHFFSAVFDKKPTGYITEAYNLVPSCGKCNQSKGGKNWKSWIEGNAKLSPSSRIINGTVSITREQLEEKIEILDEFEQWGKGKITKLDFNAISELEFASYFESCEKLIDTLSIYQEKAVELKIKVEQQIKDRKSA